MRLRSLSFQRQGMRDGKGDWPSTSWHSSWGFLNSFGLPGFTAEQSGRHSPRGIRKQVSENPGHLLGIEESPQRLGHVQTPPSGADRCEPPRSATGSRGRTPGSRGRTPGAPREASWPRQPRDPPWVGLRLSCSRRLGPPPGSAAGGGEPARAGGPGWRRTGRIRSRRGGQRAGGGRCSSREAGRG